jgi:hypothetical protein
VACPGQGTHVVGAIADIFSDDEMGHDGHPGPWRPGNYSEMAPN